MTAKKYLERCFGAKRQPVHKEHPILGKYHFCEACEKINIKLRKDGTQRVHGRMVEG